MNENSINKLIKMSESDSSQMERLFNSIEENKRIIEICSKKLEREPTCKKAILLRANLYIKSAQYEKAENDLLTIMHDPMLKSTAYYLLGVIYKKENKLEKSLEFLTHSIENDENNVNALFLRGAILNLLGKFQEAINDYYLALEKDSVKNTRKNVYKNIEKILGANTYDENNESLSTNQHESISSKTYGTNTNTDLDYEINKNLNFILRKTSTLSPILKSKTELLKEEGKKNNKAKEKQVLKDIDNYLKEREEKENSSTIKSYRVHSHLSSGGIEILNDSLESNFTGNKMTYIGLNTQTEENNNTLNTDNNLFAGYQLETDFSERTASKKPNQSNNNQIINISVASISSSDSDSDCEQEVKTLTNNKTLPPRKEAVEEWEVFLTQGILARKRGDFKTAIDEYTKAINLHQNYFKAYFNRAFAYDKLGYFKEAIEDYTKAIHINPSYPYTYYNRGITFDKINNFHDSIEDFTKAISLVPSKKEFYYNRGCSYKKIKNYSSAIEDFSKYISYKAPSFNAYFNRGICYEKLSLYKKAIEDFQFCTTKNPKNISPYYHMANIFYKMNQNDIALELYNKIISINPKYAPAYHGIGLLKDRERNYIQAIEYFTRTINIDKTNSVYYYNRGCVYKTIGIISQAINDLSNAIQYDQSNVMFYDNRAYLYAKNKQYSLALKDYEMILKKDPTNISAKKNREICMKKVKK